MSLRETIAEAIKRDTVVDMQTIGYENCWVEDATVATDGIIATFTEALLSDEAVEAAGEAYDATEWMDGYGAIRSALTAALTAIGHNAEKETGDG